MYISSVYQIILAKDIVSDVHIFVYEMTYKNAMFLCFSCLLYCICNLCDVVQYL